MMAIYDLCECDKVLHESNIYNVSVCGEGNLCANSEQGRILQNTGRAIPLK